MGDRGPRQIIGVLAFDQVGPESLERRADRAVAQHQPVMRTSGNVRRCDRHRDRAAFDDHFVARAGNDHQMPMRRRFEDVTALVQKIGADPAADLRPALRQVAEQPRGHSGRGRVGIVEAHAPIQHRRAAQSAICRFARGILSENFTHAPCSPLAMPRKTAEYRHFFSLARPLLHLLRPLGSTPRRDGRKGSLVPPHRPFLFSGLGGEQLPAARRSRTSPS